MLCDIIDDYGHAMLCDMIDDYGHVMPTAVHVVAFSKS